jgi:nitroreductase
MDAMAMKINETLETLLSHRSVRRFTDEPVAAADIERAVTAGQAASTSSAVQAYCLIRVTEASVRESIAELSGPQAMVAAAPALFVVCGDTRRHRLICEREGGSYQAGFEGFVVSVIDATLFAQNLAVAFESMGYGLCFVGGIRNDLERLTALLELPEGVYPLYGLVVGRPEASSSQGAANSTQGGAASSRPSETKTQGGVASSRPSETKTQGGVASSRPSTTPGSASRTTAGRPRLPVSAVLFEDRYPDDATVLEQIDAYDAVYRAYIEARGAAGKSWSASMAGKLGKPLRPGLAAFYEGRGADLS